MKIGDWIKCPRGEEFRIEYFHPFKNEVLLLGVSGWIRWMPIEQIVKRWKK